VFRSLRHDGYFAYRALRSSHGYAIWVVGSLSIGMAVTIAAVAMLNASMILPFPAIARQDELVRIAMSRNCGRPDCWTRMSAPDDYAALSEGLTGLQGLAAYTQGTIAVALPEARPMVGLLTSANYFDVLGVRPALGRGFNARDADTHAAVAVIGSGLWAREFGGNLSIIGRSIRVADQFVEIVGVAPALFIGIDRVRPGSREPDVWLPMWLADRVLALSAAEERRQERDFRFVGRLMDGVDASQVQAETRGLALGLAASRGYGSQGARTEVIRVWRVNPRNWKFGIVVAMPIPILVLAIACVNAANLMLARGSQRQREIAIRLAIGSGRGRIVLQLLIECAILAVLSTLVALPIAWWGLRVASNPLNVLIPLDQTVLALTVLTAIATTVAFGLAPALRVSAQQPSTALGPVGARSDEMPRQSRMRRLLVVAQAALSLGLLATAWQLVATVRSQAVSDGTQPDRLLIARFDLQPVMLGRAEAEVFYRDLLAGASRLPDVEAAGLARHTSVWTFGQGAQSGSVLVWQPDDAPEDAHVTIGGYAGGDLFQAVGLRIVAGRDFTEQERRQTRPQAAIVNQSFATRMTGPVLGSLLRVAARDHDFASAIDVRIVGIIESALEPRYEDGLPAAKVYLPSPVAAEPALALYVRTRSDATKLAQPVRKLVTRIAPRVPVLEIGSLEELTSARTSSSSGWPGQRRCSASSAFCSQPRACMASRLTWWPCGRVKSQSASRWEPARERYSR
jgi:putative ABC transport system permease protein